MAEIQVCMDEPDVRNVTAPPSGRDARLTQNRTQNPRTHGKSAAFGFGSGWMAEQGESWVEYESCGGCGAACPSFHGCQPHPWSRYLISGWCPMTVQSNDSRHHEAASRYASQRFLAGLQPARAPEGASAVTSWNLANEPPLRFCNNRRSCILLSFSRILCNDDDDADNESNDDSDFLARTHQSILPGDGLCRL